jgi:hypothetical protein
MSLIAFKFDVERIDVRLFDMRRCGVGCEVDCGVVSGCNCWAIVDVVDVNDVDDVDNVDDVDDVDATVAVIERFVIGLGAVALDIDVETHGIGRDVVVVFEID